MKAYIATNTADGTARSLNTRQHKNVRKIEIVYTL